MDVEYIYGLPFIVASNERARYNMTIGEIVEGLIKLKKDKDIYYPDDEIINSACNILEKLPRQMSIYDWLKENTN